MPSLLVPLLLAGGAALLLAKGSTSSPATPTPAPPEAVLARMGVAIGSGDPKTLREEAVRLRKEGWTMQAAGLERVAQDIEAGRAA